jgi:hypothetical protein
VTNAGVVAANAPNAAASPRRENAPRREIISVALLMSSSRVLQPVLHGQQYARKKCSAIAMQKPAKSAEQRQNRRVPQNSRRRLNFCSANVGSYPTKNRGHGF